MQTFICDICGFQFKNDTQANTLPCPVCKGKCITEEAMKEKEEIARLIENDKDEDKTPKQDADEAITEFLTLSMQKNLKEVGNDRTFRFIEEHKKADIRLKYRYYFFLAGGYIPVGERITI